MRKSSYSMATPCEYTGCSVGGMQDGCIRPAPLPSPSPVKGEGTHWSPGKTICAEHISPLSWGEGVGKHLLEYGEHTVELKYGLISVDDHVQEHPEVWTQRLSRTQWGDRMPHLATQPDGTECWMVDGVQSFMSGVA